MKKSVYSVLAVGLVLLLTISGSAWAAETKTGDPAGTVYTLTYPDGSVVTTTDEAEAKKLEGEWKLLYTGKTDADGKIVLPGWAESGPIKIVEKEVPAGYTADTTTHETDLSKGKITIINKRKKPDTPKTGDEAQPLLYAAAALGSLALLGGALLADRRLRRDHC